MLREDARSSQPLVVEGIPLSPQQRRLWTVQRVAGTAPFRALAVVEIAGPLDPARLTDSLCVVASRHEILRTGFRSLPGIILPLQVLGETAPSLERVEIPAAADAAELLWRQAEAAPFPLDGEATLRAWLSPLPAAHLLALSLPALCADAWSLENLVREVAAAYAAESSEDPIQYVDLAQALEDLLASEEAEAARVYWKRHPLPAADEPLPVAVSAAGPFQPRSLRIATGLGDAVTAVAVNLGVSARCVLLAAWHALCQRLSGVPATLGVAFAGRSYEGLDRALGLLARDLPVRPQLESGMPFAELVRRVDRILREHEEHQELFTWERFGPSEGFFPLCFDVGERHGGLQEGEETRFRLVRCRAIHDRFLLRLSGTAGEGGMTLDLDWDAGRIPEAEASRLGMHFEALLGDAVRDPATRVGDLEVLSDGQRLLLLEQLDGGAAPRPAACLHELICAQVKLTPEAVAAVDESSGSTTYSELEERSRCLAAHLRRRGVGPEVRVGVCVERSTDLVVALLGVLRAGGAYVPLDPSYPAARLAYMLEDSAVPVVVTQTGLLSALPPHRADVLRMDDPAVWEAAGAEGPLEVCVSPDNLAYVLYTSGSTGHPKGVMVSHRAILNRLLWMQELYPLATDDRVLQKTPASFDASIWELFCPLLAGAGVVMARPGGHQDIDYLASAVAARGITVLQLVPSLLRSFLDAPAIGEGRALRRLFCGGEALAADLQDRVAERLPGVRLINLYGPTEAAIDASSWPCDGAPGAAVVPIGYPLPNVWLALLDERARLVPPGAAGEVAIGGVNLARGYLGLPGMTAERFVPDPFCAERGRPGERLFRTGDLARCRPAGALDFLGRADRQVKLRGSRIELGEVEAALRRLPGVAEGVVALRENRSGTLRLVAWLVPSPDAAPGALDGAALRQLLGRVLPEFMVPAVFVRIPALPRLPNGKIDHASLPAPDAEAAPLSDRDPNGPIEELLAGIWAEVLKVERVRACDDFFELGGHSLVATQVMTRLRSAFRIELPLRTLFMTSKLSDLAALLATELRTGAATAEPPVERVPRDAPLPASLAQERLFFLDRLQPGGHAYNLPIVLRLQGALDLPAMEAAWSEIRRRHESLRTTFAVERGMPVQRIAPPAPLVLPVVDLAALPAARRDEAWAELVRTETRRPFDLEQGPLLRVFLLLLTTDDGVLFTSTHHIVSDAWSTGVLIRELKALYGALAAGRPSPLREPALQYADFAQWERRWLQGEVLSSRLAYWRDRLAGAPAGIDLPLDGARPAVQTFRGGTVSRPLGPELTAALDAFARREGVTVYMVVLTVWKVLLHHLSGQTDLVIGTSVANRGHSGVEEIVGFFVNLLAMRTDLAGSADFREVLRRVRETALGAFAHQDLPFATLVEALRQERDLARNPIFQVVFTFENARGEAPDLPGLTVTPVAYGVDTTVFDLALLMWRTEEGLSASLRYSSDLFRPATIDRMLDQVAALLVIVAERPEASLAELRELLVEIERRHCEARARELEAAGVRKLRSVRRQTITTFNDTGVAP